MDNLTRTILDMLKTGLSIQYIDAKILGSQRQYGIKSMAHLTASEIEAERLYNEYLDNTFVLLLDLNLLPKLRPTFKTLYRTTDLQKSAIKQQFNFIESLVNKGGKISARTQKAVNSILNSKESDYEKKLTVMQTIWHNKR